MGDTKRCQTLINITAEEAGKVRSAATRLEACRAAFVAHRVDPTGTPLQGNVAAVSNWIDDVSAAADAAVVTALINNVVPSHRNAALGEL